MQRAVPGRDFGIDKNGNGDENRLFELLEGVERNLSHLVQGLSLLGVKRCSHCQRFFRASQPGVLFAAGDQMVCFECIPAWWPSCREQLSCEDRQKTEGDLVYWLRSFHDARSFCDNGKPPETGSVKFELLANCLECRGTGTYLGDKRCRYCSGPGTVRIVVPKLAR